LIEDQFLVDERPRMHHRLTLFYACEHSASNVFTGHLAVGDRRCDFDGTSIEEVQQRDFAQAASIALRPAANRRVTSEATP
jgi:hypothetical protein